MASTIGLGGPSTATKIAVDGPGNHLGQGTNCGVTVTTLLCLNVKDHNYDIIMPYKGMSELLKVL